jgi:GH18 family chitinase
MKIRKQVRTNIFVQMILVISFLLTAIPQTITNQNIITQNIKSSNQLTNTQIHTKKTTTFSVIGYYPFFGATAYNPSIVDYSSLTHIIHFATAPSSTSPYFLPVVSTAESLNVEFSAPYTGQGANVKVQRTLIDSSNKYGVKVLLGIAAVGFYGGDTDAMRNIVSDSGRTQLFVNNVIAYLKRKGYHGVDMNWEWPSTSDRDGFTRYMRILRRGLDTMTPRGVLTYASYFFFDTRSPGGGYQNVPLLNQYVDFVMPEFYGLSMGQMNSNFGYSAALHKPNVAGYDAGTVSDTNTYQGAGKMAPYGLWKAGFDKKKIAPGFGLVYHFTGPTAVGQTNSGTSLFSHTVFNQGLADPQHATYGAYPEYWDDAAKVPYKRWTASGVNHFLTYENSRSFDEKIKWLKVNGYGGVMIYDLSSIYINNNPSWGGITSYSGDRQKLLKDIKVSAFGDSTLRDKLVPRIKGQIFFDQNNDGKKNISEPIMPGWKVQLSGPKNQSVTSDSAGEFKFEQLPIGTYSVSLEIKPLWQRTLPVNQSYNVLINTDTADVVCNFGAYTSNALEINLNNGWNIISLPLKVQDPRSSVLFPTATSGAFIFNGANILVDSLKNGLGFFMKFSANHKIWLAGNSIINDTIAVKIGWNLLGSISHPVPVNIISSNPPGIISSSFWVYNNTYRYADTIQPGLGYWVKVSEPGKIILQNPSLVSGTDVNYNCHFISDSVNVLKFKTPDGSIQELFFSPKTSFGDRRNISKYEIPPFFSEFGVFDVRFLPENNGNPSIASVINDTPGSGEKAIQIHSKNFPIELEWEILSSDSHIYEFTGPDNSVIAMTGKGSRPIPDQAEITSNDYTKIYKLAISSQFGTREPSSFILKQNYPNPFNGSTQISFFLPSDGYVRLDVYDVIGRIITTLVDSPKKKGSHVISFHPSENISSGIYFSRLNYITQENLSIMTNRMLYIR